MPYDPEDISCASHLRNGLDLDMQKKTITLITKALRYHKVDFDSIAVAGLSGMLFGPLIAMKLQKTLLLVRKKGDACHSSRIVEGNYASRRYIVLDDIVASGRTVNHITDSIAIEVPAAMCVGMITYLDGDYKNIWRNEDWILQQCMSIRDQRQRASDATLRQQASGLRELAFTEQNKRWQQTTSSSMLWTAKATLPSIYDLSDRDIILDNIMDGE